MSRSKNILGVCHICGNDGPLSFEHVPPKAAFNDQPVLLAHFEGLLSAGLTGDVTGKIQQKGAGAYTLCARCNNNTGTWYGHHFVSWCHQAMMLLSRSGGNPSLIYMHYVFPLSIVKQAVTMFFSVNGEKFRTKHPDLVRFVLNREEKYLPPQYRVYVYFNVVGQYRHIGVSGTGNFTSSEFRLTSEVTFPPFGYLLTIDSTTPDARLFDITGFRHYNYGEFAVLNLRLPVLETHLPLPGDYRTLAEIETDMQANREDEERLIKRTQKPEALMFY